MVPWSVEIRSCGAWGGTASTWPGRRLDLKLDQRELTYVVAKGKGHAVSKEWDLVADTIGLDIKNRKLEQTLAWGDSIRPYANSPAYAMRADSLALDTPGQQLKEVRGFGKAWLGGTIDSCTKQRDWMRGDTVVAQFVQRDSAGTRSAALSRIVARKGAQSYHLDPNQKLSRSALDQLRPGRRDRHDDEAGSARRGGSGGRPGHRWMGFSWRRVTLRRRDSPEVPGRLAPAGPGEPMTAPEWVSALGDRDPSVPIGLAAIVRAAGPTDSIAFSDLVHSYREAYLACYQPIGEADQEVSGDEVRHHLNDSVLPRLATEGWILDTAGGLLADGAAPGGLVGAHAGRAANGL